MGRGKGSEGKRGDDSDKPLTVRLPWLFRNLERPDKSGLLVGDETIEKGKKVITFRRPKPGDSNN